MSLDVVAVGYVMLFLAPAAFLFAPVARIGAWLVLLVGWGALGKGQTWAPETIVVAVYLWLVGHWSFLVRHGGRYRSRLARAVFERTPLRVLLPGWWRWRHEQHEARCAERRRADPAVLRERPYRPPEFT